MTKSLEREFHQWLQSQISPHPAVPLGIGDDAAVLDFFGHHVVISTDTIADGTHFLTGQHSPGQIGRKALAVNLSDLAAMAAQPVAAVVQFMLPRDFGLPAAKELFLGMKSLADRFHISICGGDTNTWDGPLVLGATLLGTVDSPDSCWKISGAKPGDVIVVSGSFGGSLAGHHLDFEPAVELALQIADCCTVNAATDASDSLSSDLAALAHASGCGAAIELDRIPVSDAAIDLAIEEASAEASATELAAKAIRHALTDGEDFGLILAVPETNLQTLFGNKDVAASLTVVGTFTDEPGLWQTHPDGSRNPLPVRGYDH